MENGKLDDTALETMTVKLQKIENLSSVIRSFIAQQEQKEDTVNVSSTSAAVFSEMIHQASPTMI